MLDYTSHVGIIPFPGFSSDDYETCLTEIVNECLTRLTLAEVRVLMFLVREIAGYGPAAVRQRTICEMTHLSETTVKKALHTLEDRQFITVHPVHYGALALPNRYQLVVRP